MSWALLLSPSFLGVTCPLSFLGCSLKTLLFLHQNLGSENRVLVTPTEGHMGSVSLPELGLCAWALSTPRGMGPLWMPPCRGFHPMIMVGEEGLGCPPAPLQPCWGPCPKITVGEEALGRGAA